MSSPTNAVESMLARIGMPEEIATFKRLGVDRIITLRKMSDEALREAVPDDEKRQTLLQAIITRGNLQPRRGAQPADQPHPPRSADVDFPRPPEDGRGGFAPRGRGGRGGGGGRGGRGTRGRGNGADLLDDEAPRLCRHFMTPEGCKYGDKCRYIHDPNAQQALEEPPMKDGGQHRPVEVPANYTCTIDVEVPTERIKYLLSANGQGMRVINEACNTFNERFDRIDENQPTFTMRLLGINEEAVNKAKEMLIIAVGLKRSELKKDRFQYAVNELDSNLHAARLFAACNLKNKDTPRELSEMIMRRVISSFHFTRPQEVRHFYMHTSNSDKDKLELVSKIVSQLNGVQAILFCERSRVAEMSKGSHRIMRHFNGVEPHFVHPGLTKEERLAELEKFKEGVANDKGVRERLLVASEDYAKLARKTLIPYVNLVVNFSIPRTEEYYALQSQVVGRQGTIGASFLCVCSYEEAALRELEKNIHFERFENEDDFRPTAVEMTYDTLEHPLTTADADPPADWREHLNDKKPRAYVGKRR